MPALGGPLFTDLSGDELVPIFQDGELGYTTVALLRGEAPPAFAATFTASPSSAAAGTEVVLTVVPNRASAVQFYAGDPASGGTAIGDPIATAAGQQALFRATASGQTVGYYATVADTGTSPAGAVLTLGPRTVTGAGGTPPAGAAPAASTDLTYTP